jgi:hypothetical protein
MNARRRSENSRNLVVRRTPVSRKQPLLDPEWHPIGIRLGVVANPGVRLPTARWRRLRPRRRPPLASCCVTHHRLKPTANDARTHTRAASLFTEQTESSARRPSGLPRCQARRKRTGVHCPRPAREGFRVCFMHGAGSAKRERDPQARAFAPRVSRDAQNDGDVVRYRARYDFRAECDKARHHTGLWVLFAHSGRWMRVQPARRRPAGRLIASDPSSTEPRECPQRDQRRP